MADRQPISLGWHEDVLIELRRIRQAVEKIAGAMDGDMPLWRLAGLRADPGGEFAVEVSVKNDNMGGLSAERLEELTRRCAEAPRD